MKESNIESDVSIIKKYQLFKLKSKSICEISAEIALLVLITIYPLILISKPIGGLSLQSWILFMVVMLWLLADCLLIKKKQWSFPKPKNYIDILIIGTIAFQLFKLIGKLFQNENLGAISFEIEVIIIVLGIVYLLICQGIRFYSYYFDIILYTGIIICGFLLFTFLINSKFGKLISIMADNKYAIASYILLICTISVIQYCFCRDKMRSIFYLGTSIIGFFVLFINNSITSIWMMAAVFILLPIMFRPTAEFVKRDMQMLFSYLFLLSNMSLITNYTNLIQKELVLSVESSIYIDLLLAVGGLIFFHYWERIPQGADLNKLVLRRLRKGYMFLLKTIAIIFAAIAIGGNYWNELPQGVGLAAVKKLALPLASELQQGKSAIFISFEKQGIIGGLLAIIFCSLIIARIRKNYNPDKQVTCMLITISYLFLIQVFVWPPSIVTFPIYFILLIFAAFYKEVRKKVTIQKVNALDEEKS